jgi:Flp pilus assembly protein TadD
MPTTMQSVEPPEVHFLNAALGWLELGLPGEATAELDQLPEGLQAHPDVLEVRWAIVAAQQHWDAALQVASELVRTAPGRPTGWLHRAYALRRAAAGGLKQAWTALLPAADRFPKEALIPYNLSCYACQMQRLGDARAWLRRAIEAGNAEHVKQMALQDHDLQPLWKEIREW